MIHVRFVRTHAIYCFLNHSHMAHNNPAGQCIEAQLQPCNILLPTQRGNHFMQIWLKTEYEWHIDWCATSCAHRCISVASGYYRIAYCPAHDKNSGSSTDNCIWLRCGIMVCINLNLIDMRSLRAPNSTYIGKSDSLLFSLLECANVQNVTFAL